MEIAEQIEAAPEGRLASIVSTVPDATSLTDCVRDVRLSLFLTLS